MKRILLFLLVINSFLITVASTEIDGLYYNLNTSSKTAELTYKNYSNNSAYVSGDLIIPASITYGNQTYEVTSIGDYAFENCKGLTKVTIPASVTSIGKYTFLGCSIRSLIIPASVISIAAYAFYGCSSLTDLRFDDGETPLSLQYNSAATSSTGSGKGQFYDCPLESVYLGRNLTYPQGSQYGYSPFYNITTLKELTISSTVTELGNYAFWGCNGLMGVTIPESITILGQNVFFNCANLKSVEFNAVNCTTKGYGAIYFFPKSVETVTIGDKVTHIPYNLFRDCENLKNVTIPNSVVSIGDCAFERCKSLTTINIPNSITSIGKDAFEYSGLSTLNIDTDVSSLSDVAFPSSLRIITCLNSTPPTATSVTFNSETTQNGVLFVPEPSIATYKISPYWCDFIKIEAIPNSGTGGDNKGDNENIFNAQIDNFIYMSIDEERNFTSYLPSDVMASSWESSDEDIVEVTKKGKAEAYEYGNVIVRALNSDGEALITLGVFVCPTVKINYGSEKTYEHPVIYNSTPNLFIGALDGYEIVSVSHDDKDITEEVISNDGFYTPSVPVTSDTTITVSLRSTKDPADLNGDGVVNVLDLNMLLERMMNY